MANKHILITGISRGVGKELAQICINQGFRVTGTSRNPEKIADKISRVNYLKLDISNFEDIDKSASLMQDVDILVNNAGAFQQGPAEEVPLENFRYVTAVNYLGAVKLIQTILPAMRKRGYGTIINIGSLAGKFPLPFHAPYVASKFALEGFTLSLRAEVQKFGIKVVLVAPNNINTSFPHRFQCADNSVYKHSVDKIWQTTENKINSATKPDVIAKKIMQIINKTNPSHIYAVGGIAPLLVFFKRFLPDSVTQFILRLMYL